MASSNNQVKRLRYTFQTVGANEVLKTIQQINQLAKQRDSSYVGDPGLTELEKGLRTLLASIKSTRTALSDAQFAKKIKEITDAAKGKISKDFLISSSDIKQKEQELNELEKQLEQLRKTQQQMANNPVSLTSGFSNLMNSDAGAELIKQYNDIRGKQTNVLNSYKQFYARLATIRQQNEKIQSDTTGKYSDERKQQAQAEFNFLTNLYKELEQQKNASTAAREQNSADISNTEKQIGELQQLLTSSREMGAASERLTTQLQALASQVDVNSEAFQKLPSELRKTIVGLQEQAEATNLLDRAWETFRNRFLTTAAIFNMVQRGIREVVQTIGELDSAFNGIAIVSQYTTEEVWQMYDSFLEIANVVGTASTEIIDIAGEYFRQGKSLTETLQLTEAAAVSAKIAGIDARESVEYLTSALNGYQLAASEAMAVSDKFALLAAASATDYEELAIALSKVAAQANTSGVSMDNLLGFIAAALETTREAPENIGTAFKTIFARMGEIKDYGATLEDNVNANKVATALDSIGVALFDAQGEMRAMDEVLIEVGEQWDSLNTIQQRYLATILAGTRQQTRLLSIFQDFDRTMELATLSSQADGAALAQHAKYTESLSYAMEKLNNAFEAVVQNFSNAQSIIAVVNVLTDLLNVIAQLDPTLVLVATTIASFPFIVQGVTKAISLWSTAMGKITDSFLDWAAQYPKMQKGILSVATQLKTLKNNAGNAGIGFTQLKEGAEIAGKQITKLDLIMSSLKSMAVIAAIGAVLGIIYKLANAANEAKERVKELYSEMYGNKDAVRNIQTLIEDYQALEKTIGKTNEQLEEMNNLRQQINDAGGEGANFFFANGEFNDDAYQRWLDASREQYISDLEETREKLITAYGSVEKAYQEGTQLEQTAALGVITADLYENLDAYYEAVISKDQEVADELTNRQSLAQYLADSYDSGLNELKEKIRNSGLSQELQDTMLREIASGTVSPAIMDEIANNFGEAYRDSLFEKTNYIQPSNDGAYDIMGTTSGSGSETRYKLTAEETKSGTELFQELFPKQEQATFLQNFEELGEEGIHAMFNEMARLAGENDFSEWYGSLNGGAQNFVSGLLSSIEPDTQAVFDLADLMESTIEEALDVMDTSGIDADTANKVIGVLSDLDLDSAAVGANIKALFETFEDNGLPTTIEDIETLSNVLASMADDGEDAGNATLKAAEAMWALSDAFYGLADVDQTLRELRNTINDVNEINSAISDSSLTFEQLYNLLSAYPEQSELIVNSLLTEGQISEEVAESMVASKKQQLMQELQMNIAYLESERDAKLELADSLLTIEDAITQGNLTAANAQLQDAVNAYAQRANAHAEMAKRIQDNENAIITGSNVLGELNLDQFATINTQNQEAAQQAIQAARQQLLNEADTLQNQIDAYQILYNNFDSMKWNPTGTITKAFDSAAGSASNATKATKDATEAAEEYERQLDEIYAATQRLEGVSSRLDFIDSLKELYEDRKGQEYAYLIEQQTKELEKQTEAYKDLIQAQLNERESLLEGVEPAVRNVFELVDGRLVPIMSKYNKLSDAQAESADELADTFNDLTDDIVDNTNSIIENENALKELEEERRDMVIETQEILIEAIRAEQEAIYEEKQAALEKEKELLEERKQMYSDAFAEEDYTNELTDMTAQRQNIVSQLAQLEGASDSESKRKRAELLEELTQLNQQYNDTTTEYNRDALLAQIDDEINANEVLQEELENDYNERIEDYAWLQEQIKNLTSQGVDACMEYLKTWHEDYINGTIEMKEKVEDQWRFLFEAVYGETKAIKTQSAEAIASIKDLLNGIQDLIDGWNNAAKAKTTYNNTPVSSGGSGRKQSSTSRKPTTTTTPKETTKTYWQGLYQLGSAFRIVGRTWKVPVSKKTAEKDFKETYGEKVWYNGEELPFVRAYKEGGLVPYTGIAMVHGTPSAPEAFLSSQDTRNFEALKAVLQASLSRVGNQTYNDVPVTIENINIHTDQLNNNQDFRKAGLQFGSSFKEALRERGITVNLKR